MTDSRDSGIRRDGCLLCLLAWELHKWSPALVGEGTGLNFALMEEKITEKF